MKKRASRKAAKPPPSRAVRGNRPGAGRGAVIREPGPLLYKVVELSTVDEASIERTINDWVFKGWMLDGLQFAMREQSKRPAMAFVFFTREGQPETSAEPRTEAEARVHLQRLAEGEAAPAPVPVSAYERLRQLAEADDDHDDVEPSR